MEKMIWVIGNKGMLGQEVYSVLTQAGYEVVGTDREVNFTDYSAIETYYLQCIGKHRLSWIVNCAAYTAVEKAEDEEELCYRLNVDGPSVLANFSARHDCGLIHLSTDYVFDGKGIVENDGQPRPYREDDQVAPSGVYGLSKAQGESAVRLGCARHVILRTAWLYGMNGPNFVYTMLRLMNARDQLGVVADQWGSPTWTCDLADVIRKIISRPIAEYGTFHYSGGGITNWYAFAVKIYQLGRMQKLIDHDVCINALTTDQYPTKVKRPAWSVLDKSKINAVYSISVTPWETSLKEFLNLLVTHYNDSRINRYWRT
jgi:dTDP-4-dehydrorhamnose reductase